MQIPAVIYSLYSIVYSLGAAAELWFFISPSVHFDIYLLQLTAEKQISFFGDHTDIES